MGEVCLVTSSILYTTAHPQKCPRDTPEASSSAPCRWCDRISSARRNKAKEDTTLVDRIAGSYSANIYSLDFLIVSLQIQDRRLIKPIFDQTRGLWGSSTGKFWQRTFQGQAAAEMMVLRSHARKRCGSRCIFLCVNLSVLAGNPQGYK